MSIRVRSKGRISLLLSGMLALVTFAAGITFQRFKPPPYDALRNFFGYIKQSLTRNTGTLGVGIEAQYSRDFGPPEETRNLDSALLPLVSRAYNIGASFPFPKGAGSLTIVGDIIVIVDWLGNVYKSAGGPLQKLSFPPLPNNVKAYVSNGEKPLNFGTLRVHDVLYVSECQSIAVSHEQFDPATKLTHLALSLIPIDATSITATGEWNTVYSTKPLRADRYAGQAGGGRLALRGPGRLLLSVGDYNQDAVMTASRRESQETDTEFGKVLEIDYVSGAAQIVSLGHRNPQGLLVTETGDIYSTEHGPAGGDELNRISAGANYGWPNVTLGTDYGVYDWPLSSKAGSHDGYAMPLFSWVPSIGTSNLLQIRGLSERWDGDLLVASLKASSLFRLRLHEGRVVYSEPIWIGHRIRDIAQLGTGTIVVWTDEARLIFIDIDRPRLEKNRRGIGFIGQTDLASCLACHHFDLTGPTHLAPSLANIVGREIASDSFTRYSPALKSKGGVWTPDRLRQFLANPSEFAPGSVMPPLGLEPETVSKIVEVLTSLSSQKDLPPGR